MGFFKDRYSKLDIVLLLSLLIFTIAEYYNYIFFRSMMEVFSAMIAILFAVIALNNYHRAYDNKVIMLGLAYLFIGILDIYHTFSYPAFDMFKNTGLNLSTEFWIVARFLESISILMVLLIKDIKLIKNKLLVFYNVFTFGFIYIILKSGIMPKMYIENSGFTAFKIFSEIIIIMILVISVIIIRLKKEEFIGYSYHYIFWAIVYTILSELSFTIYTDAIGIINPYGHIFKVISFYMIYKGMVVVAINDPYDRLEKEKIRFFTMFDKAKDAILLLREDSNKQLRIINANNTACVMFGYNQHQLKDQLLDMLIYVNNEKYKTLANLTEYESAFFEAELIDYNHNKLHTDISLQTFKIFDKQTKMIDIRDISVRKRYEKEINIFQAIFENAIESIVVMDKQNKIIWVNKSFEKLFGYTANEVVGSNIKAFKSDYYDELFYKNVWSEVKNTGQWRGEAWDKHKDGTMIPVYRSITTADSEHYVSVSIDLIDKKEDEMKMHQLAYIDPITGLNNLNYIIDKVGHYKPSGLMVIKFKNIRKIENQYGRNIAGKLIKSILERIRKNRFNQEIFRYSYSQFIIVFEDRIDSELMAKYGMQILNILEQTFECVNYSIDLECCIGSIIKNDNSDYSINEMLRKAQLSIDYAKSHNNGKYIEYSSEIEEVLAEEDNLIKDLKKAVKNNEIDVHYQPFVNIFSGGIYGAEALARWTHPVKGNIPPGRFIPLAEENGLIIEIGSFVLEKACRIFKEWIDIDNGLKLSVNVSIIQLTHPDFTETVKNILLKTSFPPNRLILEITESIAVENFEVIKKVMRKLHLLDISFSLDDFGMGFSSLSMLKQLPVASIKIDRSFVVDINENIQNSLLVSALIAMAYNMGLKVIVEGVETVDQIRSIKNNKGKYVQGYYFSKPVDQHAFSKLVGNTFSNIDVDSDELTSQELEAMAYEKEYFRELHLSEPKGFQILSKSGVIIEANNKAASILGYSRRELVGKNFIDMIIVDENSTYGECLTKAIENSSYYDFQKKVKTKSGRIIDVILNYYTEYNVNMEPAKINCMIEDITENIENEKKMIRMREVYRKIFAESPLAIVLWDKQYSIIEWNAHAEESFGWTKEETRKIKMDSIVKDIDFDIWKIKLDKIISGIPLQITMNNITKSGEIITCEWFNKPIYNELGEVEFILSTSKDITDYSKKEKEILKLKDVMVSQERMAEIGQLAAGIAHEINNPLTYMISNGAILSEDIEKYSKYLNDFKKIAENHGYFESKEMNKINKEILFIEEDFRDIVESFEDGLDKMKEITMSLKQYSWGGLTENYKKYDINSNVETVLIITHNEIKYSSIVNKELDKNCPEIDAFGNQINQVLLNLLTNANYSIQNKYESGMGEIIVKTWYDELYVYVSVEDNGTGIEKDVLENIFTPFYTTKDIGVGTGLGLSISKTIIEEKHHGLLVVETQLGKGTKFTIKLPINQLNN